MKTFFLSVCILGAAAAFADDEPQHRGPPPEAITACDGQKADAACTFARGDKTVSGLCKTGHDGKTLACRGPHGGHHKQDAKP